MEDIENIYVRRLKLLKSLLEEYDCPCDPILEAERTLTMTRIDMALERLENK